MLEIQFLRVFQAYYRLPYAWYLPDETYCQIRREANIYFLMALIKLFQHFLGVSPAYISNSAQGNFKI